MSGSDDFLLDEFKDRELEILTLMAEGLSNVAIGEKLFITKETVRWYNKQIYSKLGTSRRTEAIAKAQRLGLIGEGSPAAFLTSQNHNLPTIATPFLGRDQEIQSIKNILAQPYTPLLTVLGPGGMGKTRLAIEAGHQLLERYPDGVYLFELAPLTHTNDIINVALQALGITAKGTSSPKQKLFDFCREKKLLLIFDNFEHILDGAELVDDLIKAAPPCRVLVTSRERLNLYGETILELGGLRENGPHLFELVARTLDPHFRVREEDQGHVHQIVEFVGGMPLGIILAASWIDSLSVEEIAAEISRDLDMLSTGMRNIPERQRSMRTVLAASWQKLNPAERLTCKKLAIFRGGFTRKAAKTVANASIRLLQSLQHKSFIQQVATRRYDLHPLVQQFAFEKLEESGTLRETREHHLNFFEATVTDLLKALDHGDYLYPLRDVEKEKENVYMALDWGLAQGAEESVTAAKLTASMADYWYSRTYYTIGADYCARALAIVPEGAVWTQIARRHTYFLRELGRSDEYARVTHHLFDFAQSQEDVAIKLVAYSCMTTLLSTTDNYDQLIEVANQYWELSQAVAHPRHMSLALNRLGGAYRDNQNVEKAIEFEGKNVDLLRQQEDDILLASATYNLALLFFNWNRDIEAARLLFVESLALKRLIGDRGGMMRRLISLCGVALVTNKIDAAEAYLKEAEDIVEGLNAPLRKLEFVSFVVTYHEYMSDWPQGIQVAKEALKLANQINAKKYILFLNLALSRFYTYAQLPNQARSYLTRGAGVFFDINSPQNYSYCLFAFSLYWLAIDQLNKSAECYVYFARCFSCYPLYQREVERLTAALASHFSAAKLDALKAELPQKEPLDVIGRYLAEL